MAEEESVVTDTIRSAGLGGLARTNRAPYSGEPCQAGDRTRKLNRAWNRTVATVKKSMESRAPTWLARKVRHVWDGGFRTSGMHRETVRSESAREGRQRVSRNCVARYYSFPNASFTPAVRSPYGWSGASVSDAAPASSARRYAASTFRGRSRSRRAIETNGSRSRSTDASARTSVAWIGVV